MTAPPTLVRWDRNSTEIVGVFSSAASRYWLHRRLAYFHDVLDAWVRGLETVEPDPTALALGMVHVRDLPDYPPLREALAQHFGPDTPVPVQRWWMPDVIAWWHTAATVMRESIPPDGATVALAGRQVDAWKVVLPPLIVMFEVLRGVVPLPPDTTEQARATMGDDHRASGVPADHAKAQLLRRTHLGLVAVTSGNTA